MHQKDLGFLLWSSTRSLVAQMIKNLPAMQETQGSIAELGKIPWRRKWQLTPGFLPGEFHGQRSLTGYSPWGCKESNTTDTFTGRPVVRAPTFHC